MSTQRSAGTQRLKPKVWRGSWVIDLRPEFGSRYILGPGEMPETEAVGLAYEQLLRLRGERLAEPAPDMFSSRAPRTFAAALDLWWGSKRFDTKGGRSWGELYTGLVRRELGSYSVEDFAPPDGNTRLDAYVRELEQRRYGGRTIRNRISILMQVLKLCVRQQWIAHLPLIPALPAKPTPRFEWITEEMFRQFRNAAFESGARGLPIGVEPTHIYIARRKVYLSWVFYTGCHTADANNLTSDHFWLDLGTYQRINTKSARVVQRRQFKMPEPLIADLRELQDTLGRPFRPGEAVAGGPWRNVVALCQRTARKLDFPHGVNPRILRRSFARELLLQDYNFEEVANFMGHVDTAMIAQVYAQIPREAGVEQTRWRMPAQKAPTRGPGGMARVFSLNAQRNRQG